VLYEHVVLSNEASELLDAWIEETNSYSQIYMCMPNLFAYTSTLADVVHVYRPT